MTEAPDPTFYRTAGEAASAPAEKLAHVVAFDREGHQPDALTVVDVHRAPTSTAGWWAGWAHRAEATSFTISAGTRAAAP